MRNYKETSKIILYLFFMILLFLGIFENSVKAQVIMKANRTFCGVIENGGHGAFNYPGGWFPAFYNCIGPSMEEGSSVTGSRIITACLNWTDPDGITHSKGVTRPGDGYVVQIASPLNNYIRWGYPNAIVDFNDVTLTDWGDVNPSELVGTSDQTAKVTTVNGMGVQIERTIFAWSQKYHDTYIVVDAVLTNTSGNTLEGFYVSLNEGPFYMRKAKGSDPSVPSADRVGVDRSACWHHYYGGRPGDSLRIHYMYNADNPDVADDQMGGPVATQDGRLMESDIMYYAILHASETPYTDPADDVNDPLQPKVTDVYAPSPMQTEALWSNRQQDARALIYDLMAGQNGQNQPMDGQYAGTFHRANSDEQGSPDWSNLGVGLSKASVWNRSISSFGPYTFEDGQSIHLVYVSGYTGIGIEKEKEIGGLWKAGTLQNPPNLPDAQTGYFPDNFVFPDDATEIDKIKDRWISTGIDSVHKAVSRAKWNFAHNWQVPGVPAPPQTDIKGTADGVEIIWSDPEAEADPNFAGYKIWRRIGQLDTVFFELAHETGPDDIAAEHTFVDGDVRFGARYFYYVQSVFKIDENDLDAYPTNRGKEILSGPLWNPSQVYVNPKRPFQDDLSKIRIVPNPYNIKDDYLYEYTQTVERNQIMFFNLPREATLKIFTESGDLIFTDTHPQNLQNPEGLYVWDMLTDNQQIIASGVYILVIETPDGEMAFHKFVVSR